MLTNIEKLEKLWTMLERRCAMENQARLNKLPVDENNQTIVEATLNLAPFAPKPMVLTLGDIETHNTGTSGLLDADTIELITENEILGSAFMERLYKETRAAILEQKPFLKDENAVLAGKAIVTFFDLNGKPNLKELKNGSVQFYANSDAIPYPAAFLK